MSKIKLTENSAPVQTKKRSKIAENYKSVFVSYRCHSDLKAISKRTGKPLTRILSDFAASEKKRIATAKVTPIV